MHKRHDVIIVGSGLAGLAAADLLGKRDLDILIVDDNAHTGGQLVRPVPHANIGHHGFELDPLKRRGRRLAMELNFRTVRLLKGSQVLGIYPEGTLLVEDRRRHVAEYRAKTVILATGARERYLPFKGWTLPGVMSPGAAQIMMKSSGILPGVKTLIGGCSPLMLLLAAEILTNGGRVQAVLDQSRAASKLKILTAGLSAWPKILEGGFYLARLAAARVPVQQGIRIVAARGRRQLEAVVAARADSKGCIIKGTEHTYSTETLAVGYGFSPNIELPQQAGCAVSYSPDRGGWFVNVDAAMTTSVPDIYAVGETTGIAGAGKSLIEGRLAAWHILYNTGRVGRQVYSDHIRSLLGRHTRQVRYGRLLNLICQISPDVYADIPDETTICRCEEVTMGDVRRQVSNGLTSLKSIKMATRCGMGRCQGRTCGPTLFDIISALTRQSPAVIGYASARTPVKTVALGSLAEMAPTNGDNHPAPSGPAPE